MFAQLIQAKKADAAGMRKQLDRWRDEVRSGTTGYLGSTGGVTADGEMIALVRFADEASARANSDRAEQSAWWSDTEKYLTDVTFKESSDIDVFFGGGSDDAGFVQVMEGTVTYVERARELEQELTKQVKGLRPDLIGSVRANFADGTFSEFIYFTSEAEAREGEKKMESMDMSAMAELEKISSTDRFLDLSDPWMTSP